MKWPWSKNSPVSDEARELAKLNFKGPTELEARCFIADRSGGTDYGAWLQCLREIDDCVETLDRHPDNEVAKNRLESFVAYAKELKGRIGELTPERERELELEMWRFRVRKRLAVDAISQGRTTEATLDMILSMPKEIRDQSLLVVKQVADMRSQGRLPEWEIGQKLLEA